MTHRSILWTGCWDGLNIKPKFNHLVSSIRVDAIFRRDETIWVPFFEIA